MAVITGSGSEDAWQVRALITVDDGTTAVNIQSCAEDIEIDPPERGYDKIDLLADNQIPKHGGLGLCTVTINGYTLEAGTAAAGTGTGFWDIFAATPAADASDPIGQGGTPGTDWVGEITNARTRYRVSILLTNDGAATAGTSAVTSGNTYAGKRVMLADCICTKGGPSGTFSANEPQKDQLVFKGCAIDKSGAGNVKIESVALATASALTAPSAYVAGTTKW
jgi:hypothetical protein